MKKILFMVLILVPVLVSAQSSVTLVWDANTETDLAGYRLYCDKLPMLDVGNVTTIGVDLPAGDNSCYVTAYDFSGNESAPSNVATTVIGDTTPPSPPTGCRFE